MPGVRLGGRVAQVQGRDVVASCEVWPGCDGLASPHHRAMLGRNSLAQAMPQTPGGTAISVRFRGTCPASTSGGFFAAGGCLRGRLRGSRRSLDRYQAARSKAIHARPRTLEIGEHEGALAASGCTDLHLLDGSCPMNDLTFAHLQRTCRPNTASCCSSTAVVTSAGAQPPVSSRGVSVVWASCGHGGASFRG